MPGIELDPEVRAAASAPVAEQLRKKEEAKQLKEQLKAKEKEDEAKQLKEQLKAKEKEDEAKQLQEQLKAKEKEDEAKYRTKRYN